MCFWAILEDRNSSMRRGCAAPANTSTYQFTTHLGVRAFCITLITPPAAASCQKQEATKSDREKNQSPVPAGSSRAISALSARSLDCASATSDSKIRASISEYWIKAVFLFIRAPPPQEPAQGETHYQRCEAYPVLGLANNKVKQTSCLQCLPRPLSVTRICPRCPRIPRGGILGSTWSDVCSRVPCCSTALRLLLVFRSVASRLFDKWLTISHCWHLSLLGGRPWWHECRRQQQHWPATPKWWSGPM